MNTHTLSLIVFHADNSTVYAFTHMTEMNQPNVELIHVLREDTPHTRALRSQGNQWHVYCPEDYSDEKLRQVGASYATNTVCVFCPPEFVMIAMSLHKSILRHTQTKMDMVTFLEPEDTFEAPLVSRVRKLLVGAGEGLYEPITNRHIYAAHKQLLASAGLEFASSPARLETLLSTLGHRPRSITLPRGPVSQSLKTTFEPLIEALVAKYGPRGGFSDGGRIRTLLHDLSPAEQTRGISASSLKQVSVIIPVSNEAKTIGSIIHAVLDLHPLEVIVVVNGSTDNTAAIARRFPRTRVIEYERAIGHDVGRAIGARVASGGVLLFIDGDIVMQASELRPFIRAVQTRYDVALNDITPYLPALEEWDSVSVFKAWLNQCMGALDLGTASLTAVPHAIRSSVLLPHVISQLAVPPAAMTLLVKEGATIGIGGSIDVVTRNVRRSVHKRAPTGGMNAIEQLIVGDHIEAFCLLDDELSSSREEMAK